MPVVKKQMNKNYLIVKTRKEKKFQIIERFNAGIVLQGHEVKSIKNGGIIIENSYIRQKNNELFLFNLKISDYKLSHKIVREKNSEENKIKKILLRKREILKIIRLTREKNYSIVPISVFISNNLIKLEIAVSKHLKKYQIKEKEKEKEIKRRIRTKEDFYLN